MTSSLSRRVVILVVAVAALAAEVLLLHWHGVALQSADCDLPTWMQSIVPESPRFVSTLRHMHQSTDSFFWLAIAAGFIAASDSSDSRVLYVYLLVGHVLKNMFKNAIASPRGFWFCQEGHSLYCGKGYSLPSGHSMISLTMALFVMWRWPEHRWLKWVLVPIELSIWFEVLYLGTHTRMDVLVGCTCGVIFFTLTTLVYDDVIRLFNTSKPRGLVAFFAAAVVAVNLVERVQDALEMNRHIPAEWEATYERYCQLEPGMASKYMHLTSNFEKTSLVAGVSLALSLLLLLQRRRPPRPTSLKPIANTHAPAVSQTRSHLHTLVVVLITVIVAILYHCSHKLLNHRVAPVLAFAFSADMDPANVCQWLSALVQPSLALIVFPLAVSKLDGAICSLTAKSKASNVSDSDHFKKSL